MRTSTSGQAPVEAVQTVVHQTGVSWTRKIQLDVLLEARFARRKVAFQCREVSPPTPSSKVVGVTGADMISGSSLWLVRKAHNKMNSNVMNTFVSTEEKQHRFCWITQFLQRRGKSAFHRFVICMLFTKRNNIRIVATIHSAFGSDGYRLYP